MLAKIAGVTLDDLHEGGAQVRAAAQVDDHYRSGRVRSDGRELFFEELCGRVEETPVGDEYRDALCRH